MPVGPLIMEFIEFLAAGEQNRFLAPEALPFHFWGALHPSLDEKCVCNILSDKITCAVGFVNCFL